MFDTEGSWFSVGCLSLRISQTVVSLSFASVSRIQPSLSVLERKRKAALTFLLITNLARVEVHIAPTCIFVD